MAVKGLPSWFTPDGWKKGKEDGEQQQREEGDNLMRDGAGCLMSADEAAEQITYQDHRKAVEAEEAAREQDRDLTWQAIQILMHPERREARQLGNEVNQWLNEEKR